ncbi:TolB family protein [Fictibacillus barbaricus]|uniref:Translocation protein TolB n=1 Tax=Fictibacillus barbaricus TaxID=182136 RepID=A0ABU1U5E7_9BACL|nr:hypothetical protein [Fictibacillus barbaricus]MDR7074685.1 hypothetical protein [Fictibacillus barbaricus]
MLSRISVAVIFIIALFGSSHVLTVEAAGNQAAFVRDDGLYYIDGDVERKIAEGPKLSYPKISSNGIYISYLSGDSNELWVYNRVTRLKRRVFPSNATMPNWSPIAPLLAWKSDGVLNVIDVSKPASSFQNVTLGAGNYSWTPDGKGFVVSSSANLEPDGWTSVKIFTVPYDANGDLKKVKLLTTLPKASASFFAIGTSKFKWAAGGSEFAFIACPTASLSADSNTLMIVSKDGAATKIAGEMLNNPNWFHWSPKSEKLAYIKGIGRLTTENKKLTVWNSIAEKENSYGTAGFADGDFTWRNEQELVVSRQKESGWNIPKEQRPKAFLTFVNVRDGSSKQLTYPKRMADVYPKTLLDGRLMWVRTNSNMTNVKVMKKNDINSNEKLWINHVKAPSDCYGWQCVLDVYQAR